MKNHQDRGASVNKEFYQYMLTELQMSLESSKRIENRADRSIDIFLAVFTALIGGAIAVIVTVQDQIVRASTISFILFIASGGGALTYVGLLSAIPRAAHERLVRYFIHRYFRDLSPEEFSKYGRDIVLNSHANSIYGKNNFGFVRSGFLLILMLFTCAAFTGSVYMGWIAVTGFLNVPTSMIAGILLFLVLTGLWVRAIREIRNIAEQGKVALTALENPQSQ